jgi:hypothetical protein
VVLGEYILKDVLYLFSGNIVDHRLPLPSHYCSNSIRAAIQINYPDSEGSGLIIPNFMSELTDGLRFTPTDTEFEDKPNE